MYFLLPLPITATETASVTTTATKNRPCEQIHFSNLCNMNKSCLAQARLVDVNVNTLSLQLLFSLILKELKLLLVMLSSLDFNPSVSGCEG